MRKEPRQERARATVEAILEAAARILDRQGWGRFTTNASGLAPQSDFSVLGAGMLFTDAVALIFLVNRETLRAFNAEDIAKIFWPNMD